MNRVCLFSDNILPSIDCFLFIHQNICIYFNIFSNFPQKIIELLTYYNKKLFLVSAAISA